MPVAKSECGDRCADFHQHDGAEDLRESAILQVDSGEFDWEAIEEEEAADM